MSNVDAASAVLCSFFGLSARDLAEIGGFSERFARDLLAGRRPFPKDVQGSLLDLRTDLAAIQKVMFEQITTEDPTIYIYRTVEQLRASPVGKIWSNAYLGPYRVAAFEVLSKCNQQGLKINLLFAETPALP